MKNSFRHYTAALVAALAFSTSPAGAAAQDPEELQRVAKLIREEGLERSQIMETLSYLTEVIGPRLTASPNHKRANEWTRDKLVRWGLSNAHLEAWGPFGRGWSLKSFSAQVVEPQNIPLLAYPKAWSSGLKEPLVADVVYFDPTNTSDLARFRGKLGGTVVLTSPPREITPRFEPLATRMTETNLLRLANAGAEARGTYGSRSNPGSPGLGVTNASISRSGATSTNSAPTRSSGSRYLSFLLEEDSAVLVNPSIPGEAGAVFVTSASVPSPRSSPTNSPRSTSVPSGQHW